MFRRRDWLALIAFVLVPVLARGADDWQTLFAKAEISDEKQGKLAYRIMRPAGEEGAKGKKFPLVVFLHGAGERGDDNAIQLKHCAVEFAQAARREKNPAFVVFPQCPQGEKWAEVDWSKRQIEFQKEPGRAMGLVFKLVDEMVAKEAVDPSRLYVVGLSMGGYGTWHAVSLRPQFWAAAIPVCGGADLTVAESLSHTPLWVFHGDKDQAVPVENSREIVEKLKELKADVKYTEYPGVGHDSWTQTFKNDEVHTWLFSQRRAK